MITGESKVHQIIGLKSLPNALSIRCLGNGQRIRRDDATDGLVRVNRRERVFRACSFLSRWVDPNRPFIHFVKGF